MSVEESESNACLIFCGTVPKVDGAAERGDILHNLPHLSNTQAASCENS
jgi:hypothetical protein